MRDAGTVVVVVLAQGKILNKNKNMATAVSKPKFGSTSLQHPQQIWYLQKCPNIETSDFFIVDLLVNPVASILNVPGEIILGRVETMKIALE